MPIKLGNVSPCSKSHSPQPQNVNKFETIMFNQTNPIGINSVSSSNSNVKMFDQNTMSPQQVETEDYVSF